MKITEIRIYPTKKESNLKAFASVTFDEELVVTGVRIVEGKKGLFVSMPQSRVLNDEYRDIVFPITSEMRDYVTMKVMEEYEVGHAETNKPKRTARK